VVLWTRDEWIECADHRLEFLPQTGYRSDANNLYCPAVVVGRSLHERCIFRWILRAITGRREKATRDRECQPRKSKSLAQTPPRTTIFSSILFSLSQRKYYFVHHIHCFQSKIYTKSQSTLTREHVCESQSYAFCLISVLHLTAPSDSSLDFSPPSHSSIWSLDSDNLWEGIGKRTNKERMQVENPCDTCMMWWWCAKIWIYWVKQSRTSQAWHNYIQMEVIINLTTLITHCVYD